MTIYENPVKFRFKRLKSDSTNFNGTDFGWIDQITNSDSTYFYTEVTVSYPETYVYYERFCNDSNLLIVFYVQIMPDDFVMQLHRF